MKEKFAKSNWEGEEQSGANDADNETVEQLALFNTMYEKKFGYIFLICATGKSACEMLRALKQRMDNDALTEVISLLKLLNIFLTNNYFVRFK